MFSVQSSFLVAKSGLEAPKNSRQKSDAWRTYYSATANILHQNRGLQGDSKSFPPPPALVRHLKLKINVVTSKSRRSSASSRRSSQRGDKELNNSRVC
mmetsp:Transcript_26460/g.39409  ORF Transcript_26460/g.39409 Transcript_26460/m.39409 type:complete len:98 (+) Transcript_26460:116-409(+)